MMNSSAPGFNEGSKVAGEKFSHQQWMFIATLCSSSGQTLMDRVTKGKVGLRTVKMTIEVGLIEPGTLDDQNLTSFGYTSISQHASLMHSNATSNPSEFKLLQEVLERIWNEILCKPRTTLGCSSIEDKGTDQIFLSQKGRIAAEDRPNLGTFIGG